MDADTDGDGIGDRDDLDDDNDGVRDADEAMAGTNPLAADSDADGLDDARDPQPLSAATAPAAAAVETSALKAGAGGAQDGVGRLSTNLLGAATAALGHLDDFREKQALAYGARIEELKALQNAGLETETQATQKNIAGTPVPAVTATRQEHAAKSGPAADGFRQNVDSDQRTIQTSSPLSPLQALAFYGDYLLYGIFAWQPLFYGVLAIAAWFVLRTGFRRIVRRKRRS